MVRRRNQRKIFAAPQAGRGRIRVDPGSHNNIPAGYQSITEFPGYDGKLGARKLRLCMDEDTGSLRDAFHSNVSQHWVDESHLRGREDQEIVRWARKEGYIIVTFNTRDYWRERRGFKINECPGIIALDIPNNGSEIPEVARLIDNFIFQLGHKLPVVWWKRTKVKITRENYIVRRSDGGQILKYILRESRNSALHFKKKR